MDNDQLDLENFLLDNSDLERLEALLSEFNIFETLGAIRVELRHSEFLAFLMNPSQNHGFGDFFIKRLLQKTVAGIEPGSLPFTAIDLDIWNLEDIEIRREWHQIDILVLSESNKLAVIIENKIDSKEHSNQLQRYYRSVEQQFSNYQILGIYLTPEGDLPSDNRYLPLSYEVVCSLVENVLESRASTLGPDIRTLMQHYSTMLRRYILSGSELEILCRKIYRKHQRALDLLFEYRPDLQAELNDFLINMVDSTPGLTLDHCSKSYVRFIPEELDFPILKQGRGWTPSKRILLFEIKNSPNRMGIYLIIGPGKNDIREKIYELSIQEDNLFKPSQKTLSKMYQTIYNSSFLTKNDYENPDIEKLQKKISKRWDNFLSNEYPKIAEIINKQSWLTEDF